MATAAALLRLACAAAAATAAAAAAGGAATAPEGHQRHAGDHGRGVWCQGVGGNGSHTFAALTRLSPVCFHHCPSLCWVMGRWASMRDANASAAQLEHGVCEHDPNGGLSCAFRTAACQAVLGANSSNSSLLGIRVPASHDELAERCSALRHNASAVGSALCPSEPRAAAVAGAAPRCFAACPDLCGAAGGLLALRAAGRSAPDLTRSLCHPGEGAKLECAFRTRECREILGPDASTDLDLGIPLPTSQRKLEEHCQFLDPSRVGGGSGGGGEACQNHADAPGLAAVVGLAPACFQSCPRLCGPVAHMTHLREGPEGNGTAEAELLGFCRHLTSFSCALHTASCGQVLTNLSLPASEADLLANCSAGGDRRLVAPLLSQDPVHV